MNSTNQQRNVDLVQTAYWAPANDTQEITMVISILIQENSELKSVPHTVVCVLDVTSFNPYKALRGIIPFLLIRN